MRKNSRVDKINGMFSKLRSHHSSKDARAYMHTIPESIQNVIEN
jgi:hypothetical protein